MAYVIDDSERLVNKDVCVFGRLAKYDNEICISAKFARSNNISIGDEVEFSFAGTKTKYLIQALFKQQTMAVRKHSYHLMGLFIYFKMHFI